MAGRTMQIQIGAKDKTKAATNSAKKNLAGVGKSAQSMSKVVGAAMGTLGLAKLAHDFVSVNASFQKLNASLVTVTGSTDKANAAFSMLKDFASSTPFQLEEVVTAFTKMKALGLDPTTEALTSFGNTASAMGKDLNQMIEAVADASTGEFERLKEFGIKSRSEGDNVSFTFQGVTTSVRKNAAEITSYLQRLGNEQFAGGMLRQMNTIGGAFSNLQDSYSKLLASMGEGAAGQTLIDAMNDLAGQLSDPAFVEAMRNFAEGAATLARIGLDSFQRLSGEVSTTAQWAAAMSTGDIGLVEWAISGQERAAARLAEIERARSGPERIKVDLATIERRGGPAPGGVAQAVDRTPAEATMAAAVEGLRPEDLYILNSRQMMTDAMMEMELSTTEFMAMQEAKRTALTGVEEEKRKQMKIAAQAAGMSALANLASLASSHSRKAFEISKVAAIAETTINTYKSATGAYSALAHIPVVGPALGAAAAAAAVAAGLVNVQKIKSQSFGGGGGGAAATYSATGGSGVGFGTSPVVEQPATPEPEKGALTINVHGNVIGEDAWVEQNLVPAINAAYRRNVTLEFVA